MTVFARAVKRKEWPFVALCLLIGVAEAATRAPQETRATVAGALLEWGSNGPK